MYLCILGGLYSYIYMNGGIVDKRMVKPVITFKKCV